MEYVSLGKSEISVSQIGFGCMSLQLKEPRHDISLLKVAYDGGINFFDTADLYNLGQNEILLGKAARQIGRERMIIASKVGNEWSADGSWVWNPDPAYIKKAVENSLKRLETDYIDLYQLHGGTIEDPIDDIIATFEKLKKAGKIRSYGISSIRPNVIRKWVSSSDMESIMMQYSLLDTRPEETALDLIKNNSLTLLARGALAKGLLVDKKVREYLEHSKDHVGELRDIMDHAAQKNFDLALSWVLDSSVKTTTIVGIRNKQQLDDALSFQRVETNFLNQYLEKINYTLHR